MSSHAPASCTAPVPTSAISKSAPSPNQSHKFAKPRIFGHVLNLSPAPYSWPLTSSMLLGLFPHKWQEINKPVHHNLYYWIAIKRFEEWHVRYFSVTKWMGLEKVLFKHDAVVPVWWWVWEIRKLHIQYCTIIHCNKKFFLPLFLWTQAYRVTQFNNGFTIVRSTVISCY